MMLSIRVRSEPLATPCLRVGGKGTALVTEATVAADIKAQSA